MQRPDIPIPDQPGVYMFLDATGRILYVGKAKSLRSRLSSYFGTSLALRTAAMVDAASSVEWFVCHNDVEALMAEYSLIKQHRPRFNIRLRDDKSYPYLAIDLGDEWPRPMVMRGRKRKRVRYFGPYAHAYAIRETLDLLLRTFPVRTCTDHKFGQHERLGRPCLYHHIERCCAPCVGKVDKSRYDALVDSLIDFLEGDHQPVLDRLAEEMSAASDDLEFERAARLRDQLESVKRASERQTAVSDRHENIDVVGAFGDDLELAIHLFFVRGGRITGQRGFIVENVEEQGRPELMRDVLSSIYTASDEIPPSIEVPWSPSDQQTLEDAFSLRRYELSVAEVSVGKDERIKAASIAMTSGDPGTANYVAGTSRGGRVRIHVPLRGFKRDLLETVTANAEQSFGRRRLERQSDFSTRAAALGELQQALGLPEAPLRIECFDISQVQGSNPVASMVVFEDGLARKSDYRRFKITTVDGQDDFAMMEEAITRRFEAYLRERDAESTPGKFKYPPGLLLVDGGRGQLNVALGVLTDLGLDDTIPVAGLAKRFEELYVPGLADPIRLQRGSEALYLVQRVRDEAHRFAIAYHRKRRGDAMLNSVLDDVAGIGPARRKRLLDLFGSVDAMRKATKDDFAGIDGIPASVGLAVYERLHS